MTSLERLKEIEEEFARGKIYEATLVDPIRHVEGLCDHATQTITINPKVSIVDSLIHELLHRRYPTWTEQRVRKETARLLGALTSEDLQAWYLKYRRAVKKRRPVSTV